MAIIKFTPNPRKINYYACRKCVDCGALFIIKRNENGMFPNYYHCPGCDTDMPFEFGKIRPTTYKFYRAYYSMKESFIKLITLKGE